MKTKKRFSKLTAWLLTLAMLMTFMPGFTLSASAAEETVFSGGSGTEDDPYLISTKEDLFALVDAVNADEDGELDAADSCGLGCYHGYYFKQTDNIDLTGVAWTPFNFCGVYDGNGFEIQNLSVSEQRYDSTEVGTVIENEYEAAFFSQLVHAEIKNLTFTNCSATIASTLEPEAGRDIYVGIVATTAIASRFENVKTINCTVEQNALEGNYGYAGGLVGYADICNFTGCSVEGGRVTIGQNAGEDSNAGGIVGCIGDGFYEDMAVFNMKVGAGQPFGVYKCSVEADVTSVISVSKDDLSLAGGICGWMANDNIVHTFENCYVEADVTAGLASGIYGIRNQQREVVANNCFANIGTLNGNKKCAIGQYGTFTNCAFRIDNLTDNVIGIEDVLYSEDAFANGTVLNILGDEWSQNIGVDPYPVLDKIVAYTVTVSASPEEGATVTGGGTYEADTSVTVTAAANTGYKFVKWTENGNGVSTDATYTFKASANRELVAVFEAIEYVTVNLQSPRGLKEEIKIDINSTVADLKAMVADKCNVTFGGDSEYRLFGENLQYPNSKLDDDTKVLSEIGFANEQTIHLEKSTNWDSSTEPVKIFGLTITGGKGSQEPYGDYTNVDYYWNYYYKTITIKSDVALNISGTGEPNTNIIIKSAGSSKYTNLTISDLSLTTDAGACINVQGNSWVKLTVKGNNILTATGEAAQYTVDKMPALTLTNSGAYLKIMTASTGTLTATTNIEGQPGIGTYDNTSEVWGVEINGGTVIATGGEGGAGIRAQAVCIYGGNVTANGGIDGYGSNDLYPYSIEILGGTITASSESGKALSAAPNLDNYNYYTATASTNKDGTGTVAYDSTANDTYKYFKIEPRTVFIIAFDANGGTCETASAETVDGKLAEIPTPTRTGYIFNGWFDAEEGGTAVTTSTIFDADTTIYAQWTEKQDVIITETAQTFTYGETAKTFVIEGNVTDNFIVTYQQNGQVVTPKNVGVYDVIITRDEDDTYKKFEKTLNNALEITPLPVNITWENTENLVYDGNEKTVTAEVSNAVSGDTVNLTVTGNKATNVGDYTATVTALDNANYTLEGVTTTKAWSISQSGTDFVETKVLNGSTVTDSFTYGDTITVKIKPQATGQAAPMMLMSLTTPAENQMALYIGETQVSDAATADGDGYYTMTIDTTTAGLTYGGITLTAKYVGNTNMADYAEDVTLTLEKANATLGSAPTAKTDLIYNAEEQTLINAGSDITGGTLKYKLNDGEYSEELPKATNADAYTVFYKVFGDSNHNDTAEEQFTVTIADKTINSAIALTAPVKNAVPQTSIETDEYTATVVWTPEVSNFAYSTVYTATVTITPKSNYTLTGIAENGYTFNGAETVTNAVDTGEITVTYPATGGRSSGGGGGTTRYTVKFETNGGTTISNKTVTRNSELTEPTEPTKDGYKFDGWYTDKELTTAYDFDTKVTKNFTLYAKWTENKVDDTDDKTDDKTDTPDTPVWENPFTDVESDDWYYENVEYAVENGLFNGTTTTTFAPNGIITRAMMVTVLYRAEGEPTVTGEATFEDVDENAYYAKAVVWGQQNGIIKGYSETEFAPDQNIIREQIAAIMHRYAQYKGIDVSVGENTNILSYDDFAQISEYAIAAMQYAVGSGLMKGKTESTLNPLDNATRAEIAAILHRFIEANK